MTNEAGVPDQREELSRKSFETMDWLYTQVQNGQLTKAQFQTGVNSLFMTCAGLVDQAFSHLIGEMSQDLRDVKAIEKRIFMRALSLVVVTRIAGESAWSVNGRVLGVAESGKSVLKATSSPKEAQDHMELFCTKLIASGYEEL